MMMFNPPHKSVSRGASFMLGAPDGVSMRKLTAHYHTTHKYNFFA